MASEEMWDKLFERVDKFADEVKAATDIAAEVEREAKSAADMARLARHIAGDADIVAYEALGLVFISYALKNPELARARKDSIIKTLK